MSEREEALKLLLESNITQDLKDINMVNRISALLEKVIAERNELQRYKTVGVNYIARTNEMKDSIRKLLDGAEVIEWMDGA